MRILLVEDSRSLTEALETLLKREKYSVEIAYNGEEGLAYGETGVYDLIILDIMMPKLNGLEVLRQLRAKNISSPVLMLTALSQDSDKIAGLDSGADDYLTKPFSMLELLARVRALTRRKGELISGNVMNYLGVALNFSTYSLSFNDKSVKLSRKECDLMRMFFEQPTFVMQREQLINKVWGFETDNESNNLEVFISFLRKKLAFLDAPFSIIPVRGVGYRLSEK